MHIATRLAAAAVLATGLAAGSARADIIVNITGYTNGCFDPNGASTCTPVASPAPQAVTLAGSGLTYNSATFNVVTDPDGFVGVGGNPSPPINIDNFGSFTLTLNPNFNYAPFDFQLLVTFTAPPGTTPGSNQFQADLRGNVQRAGNGVQIKFDPTPISFDFLGGSFTFSINDVSVTTGQNAAVTGQFQATIVPEPGTLALFGAGLLGLGAVRRSRRQPR